MLGQVHPQRHHRLWRWPRQPDRRQRVERWRARRAAGALSPAPRCLPRAARRRGVCPPQPPPRPDQRLSEYQVLTRARGRCECSGTHEHQRALEVDHIIPKNQGASDAISNLQALCFRCNAGKRDGCLPTQEGAPTSAAPRPATATAKRAVCSARWSSAAGAGGERGAQPGDPASSWGRRAGAAPAGVERRGGAAEDVAAPAGFPVPPGARTHASTGQATPIQERCCKRSGSWRPCRAITRISAPCSRK